ncbi:unnamed protein product [Dibothriocephalus latus]|uniref:DUF4806 domain-containing protein n=1 Tax=Dibothriocephalus latus TaxID=60516 RepID=A0A3P7R2M4_DIBLA|nr:unnamed protein product [Dibothriocephalus latus]
MLAWLKAMDDRLETRFEARMEALEAIVRQSNELNRRAYEKSTRRLDDFEAVSRTDNGSVRIKLDTLVKRVDHMASEHSVLLAKVEQVAAALRDSHRSMPTGSTVTVGRLPLCSQESLSNFLDRFKSDKDCQQQTVDGLIKICGRSAKDTIRSILSRILGPPLILQFTYSGAAKNKMSFSGSPLHAVFCGRFTFVSRRSEAVRQHPHLRNVDDDVVRNTVIEWFHGSRDRYGGVRGKRKDVVQGGFLDLLNSANTETATLHACEPSTSEYEKPSILEGIDPKYNDHSLNEQ